MNPAFENPVNGGLLNAWKIVAVFLPFALALLLSLEGIIKGILFVVLGITLFGLLVAIWIAGLVKAFPVWTLPSLGILFFVFYFYILKTFVQAIVYILVMRPLLGGWPEGNLTLRIALLLLVSFGIFLTMAGALLFLIELLPKFKGWIRKDWTQLSFFFYGMAIGPMFMDDEFHHLASYQIASLLILAVGAGLYLKAPRRWLQILVLVVPVVASQVLLILALYHSYPFESWINLADPTQRIWESIQPLSDPLPVLLLLPALFTLIPWRKEAVRVPSENPTLAQ